MILPLSLQVGAQGRGGVLGHLRISVPAQEGSQQVLIVRYIFIASKSNGSRLTRRHCYICGAGMYEGRSVAVEKLPSTPVN